MYSPTRPNKDRAQVNTSTVPDAEEASNPSSSTNYTFDTTLPMLPRTPSPPREPSKLLSPYLPVYTTLYTSPYQTLACKIDPCSSRSFITAQTLEQYFPSAQPKQANSPLYTIQFHDAHPAATVEMEKEKPLPELVDLKLVFADVRKGMVGVEVEVIVSEREDREMDVYVVLGRGALVDEVLRLEKGGDGMVKYLVVMGERVGVVMGKGPAAYI